MIPWELLDSAPMPGSGEVLRLYKRGEEFSIRVESRELMNSRVHGSEDALAELACARIAGRSCPRILVGVWVWVHPGCCTSSTRSRSAGDRG